MCAFRAGIDAGGAGLHCEAMEATPQRAQTPDAESRARSQIVNKFLDMHQKDHSDTWNVRAMDLWAFARTGARASGELPPAALPRLFNEIAQPSLLQDMPALHWTAVGEIRVESTAIEKTVYVSYLQLTLNGALWLECQRCLAPYSQTLTAHTRYRIVETEQQADPVLVDEDEIDAIVGAREFDLLDLIDQELCLALPLVPKHAICPTTHEALRTQLERDPLSPGSPFETLAALKRK